MDAEDFEKKYVHTVYNTIAPHFSHTRYSPWKSVQEFLLNLKPTSRVLDIGCGNGKYLGVNDKCVFTGLDMCDNLLDICRSRGFNVVQGNMTQLPFKNSSFDVFICIATLHHLSTDERRICALKEMARILEIGGRGLIYVWSFEHGGQKKNKKIVLQKSQESMIEWNTPLQLNIQADEQLGEYIEKKNVIRYTRYYHMFKEGELEKLILSVPQLRVVKRYLDCQNWVVIVERI